MKNDYLIRKLCKSNKAFQRLTYFEVHCEYEMLIMLAVLDYSHYLVEKYARMNGVGIALYKQVGLYIKTGLPKTSVNREIDPRVTLASISIPEGLYNQLELKR